jgi:RNA polymerase sigma-70 factor (ECF subfamily)
MFIQHTQSEIIMEPGDALTSEQPDLVDRAKGGDNRAFMFLCKENAGHIYAVCLRMLADPNMAKELTQVTLIRAWEMIGTFRGESPFGAWIHRIAVNAVLDHIKHERRRSSHVSTTDAIESYNYPSATVSFDEHIDLEQAIALLPPQARAVIVLHDIEGYSHEEIGAMLGIAPGTSKAHLNRARFILKERLVQ